MEDKTNIYIYITENPEKMIEIGKRIIREKKDIYTEQMIDLIRSTINDYLLSETDTVKEEAFYRSIYDYWVYGNSFKEEFYLRFRTKTHEEKKKYITFRTRFSYYDYLNKKDDRYILADKYELFTRLKEYYKREIILLEGPESYETFSSFCDRNDAFVVKPDDLSSGRGIRKEKAPKTEDSKKQMFTHLLEEAGSITKNDFGTKSLGKMVLEQVIIQHPKMAVMHPVSVNVVRITTIRVGDEVYSFYPWVKFGAKGNFVAAAATLGCCALIDPKSGLLSSDGYDEMGYIYQNHPDTGIPFKDFQIPEWEELVSLAKKLAMNFETLRYIGWDFAYSEKGWCVIEANSQADFAMQMMLERGIAPELESLLGWKPEKQFWWE